MHKNQVKKVVFHTRIDSFTVKVMVGSSIVIGASVFLPLLLSESTAADVLISIVIFLFSIGFFCWIGMSIRYIFHNDYLLVKGGPFRYRIRYGDITEVSQADDYISGLRMMLSKTGLEIFYRSGLFGSIKISPDDEERFLAELQRRCPGVEIVIKKTDLKGS
ncbi:PH domain-containing protein [Alteribacter natronophilus]|uniref:PH domain-containing protein n=1 Tax=Alteribacter natronophilus TaxID=2583810 RepID=UPI00110F5563|nr:PH domain-containing protein [Alteribacter natronophilus]TMW70741.1 hypothetical protein FGB90_16310 [Alteribacter natronophilus]